MPRPELYPVKKVIGFDQAMLKAIDNWRRKQSPIPTVSEAIRQLVALGLAKPSRKRTGNTPSGSPDGAKRNPGQRSGRRR